MSVRTIPNRNPLALNGRLTPGLIFCAVLATTSLLGWTRVQLIELLFLLAPLVVVPMAVPLIIRTPKEEEVEAQVQGMVRILFGAGVFVAVSFFQEPGAKGAWLSLVWPLACLVLIKTLTKIPGSGVTQFGRFCFALGAFYLGVGAIWLVASRLGLHPLGFQEPIVLLTAVHFHFAGFVSAVMAGLVAERLRGETWASWLRVALLGTILGPGALALAFLIGPKLKLVAVLWIVTGEIALAGGLLRVAGNARDLRARWLLRVSGASIVAGMLLAAAWAIGEYPLHPFLDLQRMTRLHGVLNAFGFALCGLLGWSTLRNADSELQESTSCA